METKIYLIIFIYLFILQKENFKFSPISKTIHQNTVITNIVPGDFNYDGNLDVLVMSQPNPDQLNSEIKLTLYFGNGNDSFGNKLIIIMIMMMI